jgi:hypothetical protein
MSAAARLTREVDSAHALEPRLRSARFTHQRFLLVGVGRHNLKQQTHTERNHSCPS